MKISGGGKMNMYKRFAIVVIATFLFLFVLFIIFTEMMKTKLENDNAIPYTSAPATENNLKNPEAYELNAVTYKELSRVEGIGRTLAQNIISYREKIGGFTSIKQLMDVTGMDKNTYNYVKSKLYVEGEKVKFEDEKEIDIEIKVNINTATIKELMSLPSVTESIAQKIVDYRKLNGNFISINEVLQVDGIGEGIFNSISAYITV